MADGTSKAIEDVHVGDVLQGYDPATHALVAARVLETRTHSPADITGLVIVNESVIATANHPFVVGGKGVRADALHAGDPLVRLSAGGAATPDRVKSVRLLPNKTVTYDIVVAQPGTFFAGGVLAQIKPVPLLVSP